MLLWFDYVLLLMGHNEALGLIKMYPFLRVLQQRKTENKNSLISTTIWGLWLLQNIPSQIFTTSDRTETICIWRRLNELTVSEEDVGCSVPWRLRVSEVFNQTLNRLKQHKTMWHLPNCAREQAAHRYKKELVGFHINILVWTQTISWHISSNLW